MSFILRLVHPEHGATHVYDQSELERHEKLGWHAEGARAQAKPEVATPKKRGRKPKVGA